MAAPRSSRWSALALALATALTPACVLAQSDGSGDGLRLPTACNPLEPFARRCMSAGSTERPGLADFTFERSPWSVPGPSPVAAHRRASYPIESSGVRVVPSVVYLPDPDARMPGVVSVGLERAPAGDPLRVRGELGWSGRPGGSLDLEYRVSDRNASLRAEQRPAGAVVLPNGRAPGHTWDGVWTERLGARTTASVSVSNDSLDLQDRAPESTSGRFDLRHRAGDGWSVFVSLAGSTFEDAAQHAALARGVTSVGTEFRAGIFDVSATYRGESNSLSPSTGHGGRLALRSSLGRWQAGLYADAQQGAATLELDGAGQPELPQSLIDVGLAGASPESAVRMLRDRGPLMVQHGIELGALRVDPLRVQGGLDLRWRDSGWQGTEVGVLLAMDDLQGTEAPRRALLGQVRMSWRLFRETDVSASYANWSLQADPLQDEGRSLFKVLLRSKL